MDALRYETASVSRTRCEAIAHGAQSLALFGIKHRQKYIPLMGDAAVLSRRRGHCARSNYWRQSSRDSRELRLCDGPDVVNSEVSRVDKIIPKSTEAVLVQFKEGRRGLSAEHGRRFHQFARASFETSEKPIVRGQHVIIILLRCTRIKNKSAGDRNVVSPEHDHRGKSASIRENAHARA